MHTWKSYQNLGKQNIFGITELLCGAPKSKIWTHLCNKRNDRMKYFCLHVKLTYSTSPWTTALTTITTHWTASPFGKRTPNMTVSPNSRRSKKQYNFLYGWDYQVLCKIFYLVFYESARRHKIWTLKITVLVYLCGPFKIISRL